jgi:GDPmannose 4,6-dehydratase
VHHREAHRAASAPPSNTGAATTLRAVTAPRALVLGVAGQDGSYLAELLVARGYAVTGLVRRTPETGAFPNLAAVDGAIELVRGDVADATALHDLVARVRPREIYNVASTSTLHAAWADPLACARETALPVATLLEAILAVDPSIRLVQASSAQVFGDPGDCPQDESTPRAPNEPYGAAKAYGDAMIAAYRERHGVHASAAILFNHESPRRPTAYVTRKVTRGAAAIALGRQERLELGDLEAVRDWSFAGDVADGILRMAQANEPGDYVLASGVGRTVGDLVRTAFAAAGVEPDGRVAVDPALVRPPQRVASIGDPSRARERLGWRAQTTFEDLVGAMVQRDLAELSGGDSQAVVTLNRS